MAPFSFSQELARLSSRTSDATHTPHLLFKRLTEFARVPTSNFSRSAARRWACQAPSNLRHRPPRRWFKEASSSTSVTARQRDLGSQTGRAPRRVIIGDRGGLAGAAARWGGTAMHLWTWKRGRDEWKSRIRLCCGGANQQRR